MWRSSCSVACQTVSVATDVVLPVGIQANFAITIRAVSCSIIIIIIIIDTGVAFF